MNALLSVLLKNIILFALIGVSLVFVLTGYIGFNQVRYLFIGLGVGYVIAACYEAQQLSVLKTTTKKFVYITDGFLAKRFIKIIILLCSGTLLYLSSSIVKYMAFLCFLLAFTELVVTIWRCTKHLCFVAFEPHQLVVSTNRLDIIKASEIANIETRHGLTYFVTRQHKSLTLRTDMMKEQQAFTNALYDWVRENELTDKAVTV